MSWFPDYRTHQSDLSDEAFLAAGKALHICTLFELKVKWILKIGQMDKYCGDNSEATLEEALDSAKSYLLMNSVRKLKSLNIKENEFERLAAAVEARNYIAHESTTFFHARDEWLTIAAIKKLREEFGRLCSGANLVFLWAYEIENKEPGPSGIFQEYPQLADDWVFGPVNGFLKEHENNPELAKAEASLTEYFSSMNI